MTIIGINLISYLSIDLLNKRQPLKHFFLLCIIPWNIMILKTILTIVPFKKYFVYSIFITEKA